MKQNLSELHSFITSKSNYTKTFKQDLLYRNVLWLKKYPEYLGLWTLQTPKAINREFIGGINFKKKLSWNLLANQLKWPSVDSQTELPGRALRASENTVQPRPIKSVSGNETQASALLKTNMQPKLRTIALYPSYSVYSVDQQQDYPLGTS